MPLVIPPRRTAEQDEAPAIPEEGEDEGEEPAEDDQGAHSARCHSSSHPARPRSSTNPQTSVKVVTKIEEATAGSTPKRSSTMGMNAPANPATSRLPDIARKTTSPSRLPSPRIAAASPTTAP